MKNISPERDIRFFGAHDEARRAGSQLDFPVHTMPSPALQKITADQNSNWLVFKESYSAVQRR